MSINEVVPTQGVGDWSLKLRPDTPAELVDLLGAGAFGHIAILAAREDVRVSGDALLRSARYNGVLRGLSRTTDDGFEISGPGMAMWLGDEDGKSAVYETEVAFNGSTFKAAVEGLLAASDGAVIPGIISTSVAGTYARIHQYESPRAALTYLCGTLPGEFRVNGDATLDAGTIAELYGTDPAAAVVSKRAGLDGLLRGLSGKSVVDQDVDDFTTRVVVLGTATDTVGETSTTRTFVSGTADIAPGLNPYTNLHGGVLKLTRLISESSTSDESTAAARAQLALNRFTSPRQSLTLSSDQFDVRGDVAVGQYLWAYDPDAGLVDATNEIHFMGDRIAPVKLRLFKMSWPVRSGMGVAFRARSGQWIDLTDYVEFETGATTLTVGGYDRALTSSGDTIVSGRVVAPDSSIPDVPTWVTPFQQGVYRSAGGTSRAQVQLKWTRPTNTDGSTIVDGDHYEIRYRTSAGSAYPSTWSQAAGSTWNAASAQPWGAPVAYVDGPWQSAIAPFDATSFLLGELTPNLPFVAQIRAVDTASPPNYGEWSAETSFTTVEDTIPPVTPAPPSAVGNTMAILLTHMLGASSGGTFNLDLDTDHLDVYMGSDPTFDVGDAMTTKLGEMPASASLIRATVPSVKTFQIETTGTVYIKVVAVDTAGNRSNSSDSVAVTAGLIPAQYIQSLTADQITSGQITARLALAGEIATGPDGQGMHMMNSGLTGYRPDGVKVFDFDTSDGSLLVMGEYRTAPSGQRLVINQSGSKPDSIYVFPSGSGDFGRIMARTSPGDGSAAILIDGGAASGVGRGRLGAYKGEAFVSWVTGDAGGDTSTGYSRTAVSCNSSNIEAWAQSRINFYKYSGSSFVSNSQLWLTWANGGLTNCPVLGATAQDSGIKFDSGTAAATNAIGTLFGPFKCSALTQTSTIEEKVDVIPIKQVLTPLDVLDRVPSKAWKYTHEVAAQGNDAPQHFGPIAEDLPPELVWMTQKADGSGLEPSIEFGSTIGMLWAMLRQLRARRITSTTGTCVVPAGTILTAGSTREVACSWESSPLAPPTDALCFLNAGLLGAGKVTAYVKPGSVTPTGCTVVFKNTSTSAVVAATSALAGLTSITATVIGQALYTPDVDY